MIILGVDPGLSGGLVLLDAQGAVSFKFVMPTVGGNKGRREYDVQTILQLVATMKPEHAILERQQALPPKMGGSIASFSKGFCFGLFQGIFASTLIPYSLVRPQAWQKVMFQGLSKADTKTQAYLVCQRLWPTVDWRPTQKSKKPHDGLTDAALIARWGQQTLKG